METTEMLEIASSNIHCNLKDKRNAPKCTLVPIQIEHCVLL